MTVTEVVSMIAERPSATRTMPIGAGHKPILSTTGPEATMTSSAIDTSHTVNRVPPDTRP